MSMDGRLIAFADTLDIDIWASDDRGRLRTIKTRDVVDHVCFTPDASRIVARHIEERTAVEIVRWRCIFTAIDRNVSGMFLFVVRIFRSLAFSRVIK